MDAMLAQLAPYIVPLINAVKPIVDQPVIRMPYNLPLATSQSVPAGQANFPLNQTNFSHSLEWPFEIRRIKFSNDPAHTFRDWQFFCQDITYNQPWMKAPTMVATLIEDNTAVWELEFPWIIRNKGGGLQPSVSNLDTVNPITVDINFEGYVLIPR